MLNTMQISIKYLVCKHIDTNKCRLEMMGVVIISNKKIKKGGPVRDLNPGPLAPKARIIPLDQLANLI